MTKLYIAGPMTHIPHFNFPAFDRAAAELRAVYYDIVTPSELDSPEDRAAAMASPDGAPIHYDSGKTWGDFLARDIKLIVDTPDLDGIVVLPGWEKSRGARFETFTGNRMRSPGVPVYRYDPQWLPHLDRVRDIDLADAWLGSLDVVISTGTWEYA